MLILNGKTKEIEEKINEEMKKESEKQNFERAIELRKFAIRSANTGISCFIEPSGKIMNQTTFWIPATIKHKLQINNRITFYAHYGDYIGKIGTFAALLFVLIWISNMISEKRSRS